MSESLYLKLDYSALGRKKYLVGEVVKTGSQFTFHYLSFPEGEPIAFKKIQYLPLNLHEYSWKDFPAAFDEMVVHPTRPDVPKVLALYGMSEYNAWELLKRSKGKSPNDYWQFETNDDGVKCLIVAP